MIEAVSPGTTLKEQIDDLNDCSDKNANVDNDECTSKASDMEGLEFERKQITRDCTVQHQEPCKENSEEPQKPQNNGDCANYTFKECGQYDGELPQLPNCGKNDAPLPEGHQCSEHTGGTIDDSDDPDNCPDKKPEDPGDGECNNKVTPCDGQAPGCPEQDPNCKGTRQDYENSINFMAQRFTEGVDIQSRTLKNHFGNDKELEEAFEKAMTFKLVTGNYKEGINNRDAMRKDIIKDVLGRVGNARKDIDQEGEYNGLKDTIAATIGDTIIKSMDNDERSTMHLTASEVKDDVNKLAYMYLARHKKKYKDKDKDDAVDSVKGELYKELKNRLRNHFENKDKNYEEGLDIFRGYWKRHNGEEDLEKIVGQAWDKWDKDKKPFASGRGSTGEIKDVLDGYFNKKDKGGFKESVRIANQASCSCYNELSGKESKSCDVFSCWAQGDSNCGKQAEGDDKCGAQAKGLIQCGILEGGSNSCGAQSVCPLVVCGVKLNGASQCVGQGGGADLCGTKLVGEAACGADSTWSTCFNQIIGAVGCGANSFQLACVAHGLGAYGCGVNESAMACGAKGVGVFACAANATATACGQDAIGIHMCPANASVGACGQKKHGAAACGGKIEAWGCGADAEGANVCRIKAGACGGHACGADVCQLNVCGANVCGANILPCVPGI